MLNRNITWFLRKISQFSGDAIFIVCIWSDFEVAISIDSQSPKLVCWGEGGVIWGSYPPCRISSSFCKGSGRPLFQAQ